MGFDGIFTFGEWLTYRKGIYLRFEHQRYDLCVELNTYGMGAFTLQLGERIFTRLVSGRVLESGLIFGDPRLGQGNPNTQPAPKDATWLGNFLLRREASGCFVAEHKISRSRVILEPYGEEIGAECLRRAQSWSLLEVLRKEFGVKPADRQPVPPRVEAYCERILERRRAAAGAVGAEGPPSSPATEDHSNGTDISVPGSSAPDIARAATQVTEPTAALAGNLVKVTTVEGRQMDFSLPFEVDARERQILELLGRYGKLTETGLRKSLNSKRARLVVSGLIRKLHDHNCPLVVQREISDSEGQIYEFDFTLTNRSSD